MTVPTFPATIVVKHPINVCHVHPIDVNEITRTITINPQIKPMNASLCLTCGKSSPRKKVPRSPPYVTEAICRPISTTGFFVSLKSIAPPISTIPQSSVKKRDHFISLLSFFRSGFEDDLNRSRYEDDARELIDEDRLPIAEAKTPASTRPVIPVGKFSIMNLGNTSSDEASPNSMYDLPP